MKKIVQNITIRVFEKDPEQLKIIHQVFHQILPVDFEEEKIQIEHEKAEGFEETIHILSLKTNKNRHNKMLLKNIFQKLKEKDKNKIYAQRETRLDENGYFYLRLDKPSLIQKNEYSLVEHGNCFHFKIKIAAYPSNRKNQMRSLNMLLQKKSFKMV